VKILNKVYIILCKNKQKLNNTKKNLTDILKILTLIEIILYLKPNKFNRNLIWFIILKLNKNKIWETPKHFLI